MEIATQTKRDRSSENFARAMRRYMRRGDQMSRRYDTDVYILIRRNRCHYDYNSTKDPLFPPRLCDLVSGFSINISLLIYD